MESFNIIKGNNTNISGNAWAGAGINNHNPSLTGQSVPPRIEPDKPSFLVEAPVTPPLLQGFNSGTIPQDGLSVEPGTYGKLTINGNSTTTLKGGTYYFSAVDAGRSGLTLRLDLSEGPITVFITGKVNFSGSVEVSTDGVNWTRINELEHNTAKELAQKVYWENHGTFTIATNNSIRQWFGTVLSKQTITLNSGFYGVGAFVTTEGNLDIASNPTVIYSIADFTRNSW